MSICGFYRDTIGGTIMPGLSKGYIIGIKCMKMVWGKVYRDFDQGYIGCIQVICEVHIARIRVIWGLCRVIGVLVVLGI